MKIFLEIAVCVAAVVLSGIVVPIFINWLCDKKGWFK